ncbi:MAG: hotdog fold domain-containing protein [Polyangiaceae bacterium]
MSIASKAQALLFDVNRPGNMIRDLWDKLGGLPGGGALFTGLIGQAAPYTGTIKARVLELREGYARVGMDDRRGVRNHLRSVHAIALVNLAELTGNVALAYSLPDDARFIVAGLQIDYLKKARGPLVAHSRCPVPATSESRNYDVPVTIEDASGEVVARATLNTLVGPKRRD